MSELRVQEQPEGAAPPVQGAANAALVKVLAKALRVPKTSVEIIRGERSREKVVRVFGLRASDVLREIRRRGDSR